MLRAMAVSGLLAAQAPGGAYADSLPGHLAYLKSWADEKARNTSAQAPPPPRPMQRFAFAHVYTDSMGTGVDPGPEAAKQCAAAGLQDPTCSVFLVALSPGIVACQSRNNPKQSGKFVLGTWRAHPLAEGEMEQAEEAGRVDTRSSERISDTRIESSTAARACVPSLVA